MQGVSSGKPVNLTQYMDETPWTVPQKLVLVLAALAFTVDGCANQILGVAMPAIIADWGVSRAVMAPVAAIGLLGIAVGAAVGGMVADRIGRRRCLILACLLFGGMTVLAALANGVVMLAAVRFLDGLGLGAAIPSAAALLSETSPRRRRAIAIAVGMVFIPAGGFLSGLLGGLILPDLGWRALFLLVGLLSLGTAALFAVALPESPFYLVLRPDRQDELGRVMRRFKREIDPEITFFERMPTQEERRFTALLSPSFRTETLGVWIGFFCCLLATYTMFNWLPTLLSGRGFQLDQTSFFMSAFHAGAMCGGLLAGFVMQRYGVRIPLMLMSGIAALVAVLLSVLPINPGDELLMIASLAVLGLLLAGMHNGFYTLPALVYPTALRATGIGAAAAFGRLGAITSSFTGVISMNLSGSMAYFLLIALSLLVAVWSVRAVKVPAPSALAD
jgi:AAHS family 4-hydroxybenzoate transporter-like MFS transporter